MFSHERPAKLLRLAGPRPHTRSIHLNVRLEWSYNRNRQSAEALLCLDSGARGAVLSSSWVSNTQLPYICRETLSPISEASGHHIPASGLHYTKTIDMTIGDHINKTRFDLADMLPEYLDGYLPMS